MGVEIDFEEIEVHNKKFSITLDYVGEGTDGDYDSENPKDVPLLRYDVCEKVDGSWEPLHNGSACCQLSTTEKRSNLKKAAKEMLNIITKVDSQHLCSIVQLISWIYLDKGKVIIPKSIKKVGKVEDSK